MWIVFAPWAIIMCALAARHPMPITDKEVKS
jgi:hypothetical protein